MFIVPLRMLPDALDKILLQCTLSVVQCNILVNLTINMQTFTTSQNWSFFQNIGGQMGGSLRSKRR